MFSASDSSDPRVNGRLYELRFPPNMTPLLLLPGLLLAGLLAWREGLRGTAGDMPEVATALRLSRLAVERMRAAVARLLDWTIRAIFALSIILVLAQQLGLLDRSIVVPASTIVPEQGNAYYVKIDPIVAWSSTFYDFSSDIDGKNGSVLWILEDGQPLPGSHSQHLDIVRQGHGRYSHWADGVLFSTRDNSDPRTNGRIYDLRFSPSLFLVLLVPGLLLAGLLTWRESLRASVGDMFEVTAALRLGRTLFASLYSGRIGAWAGKLLEPRLVRVHAGGCRLLRDRDDSRVWSVEAD
jgi:hypothetical protein